LRRDNVGWKGRQAACFLGTLRVHKRRGYDLYVFVFHVPVNEAAELIIMATFPSLPA
jgi:hypothetical protein